jgi:tRNA-dihydrouridine synthase B
MSFDERDYWQGSIRIKDKLYPRFIGGPLDGITDAPFRRLVREFSADELLYTEMRHVACVANDKGGVKSLNFEQLERPLNYQVAANHERFIAQALERIVAKGVDMVDLNIGCPARNVIGSGSGSALMADLPRLKQILVAMRSNLNVPFTLKIRAGFKTVNAVEVAQLAQDCGVDALAIHPRLQTQHFEGRPDYALVAEVKKAIQIPVIVSGGVVNFKTAQMVYEQTGVDGYLIGRGIWAKPWKLHEMREHAAGREFVVDRALIYRCALRHFELMLDYYGLHAVYVFRKHLPFYVRGLPDAAELRKFLVTVTDPELIKQGLTQAMAGSL